MAKHEGVQKDLARKETEKFGENCKGQPEGKRRKGK